MASEHPQDDASSLRTVTTHGGANERTQGEPQPQLSNQFSSPEYGNRSEAFDQQHEPFRYNNDLRIQNNNVTGPIWFMNPTRALFSYNSAATELHPDNAGLTQLESKRSDGVGETFTARAESVQYKWTSRNNRKGRHALIIHESDEKANPYATPPTTTGPRPILRGIWRMLTVFTIHDVSYLLAVTFSAACLILVVTAILSFLPYANSSFPSSTVLYRIEAVLSAFGATAFFVGSLFAFSEAVNVNRKGCFGWRLQRISNNLEGLGGDDGTKGADITLLVPDGSCSHHHDSYKVVAGHPQSWSQEVSTHRAKSLRPPFREDQIKEPWVWLPSRHEICTHLRYDYGFVTATMLACSSCLYSAMAWAAVATTFKSGQVASWIRIPQVIAAAGFTFACSLSMVETQRGWFRPSWGVIGWHANALNTAGSIGFLLTAVFGYLQRDPPWAEYQFGCSLLWGSLAFLLGSLLQWFEALDKYPVERVKAKDG